VYDFSTILSRLKELIAAETGKTKVKDKEVAAALGLTPEYFAVIKKRGKIPYDAILRFCIARGVSANWVIGGQTPVQVNTVDSLFQNSYNKTA